MKGKTTMVMGAHAARVLLAILFATGVAIGITGLQAFLPQVTGQAAYASEWSDKWIKQVDALPAADKMNLSQAYKADSLAQEYRTKFFGDGLTEEEDSAIGSDRFQKCLDGALRIRDLEIAAEIEAEEQALNAKKKAFAKNKVKGLKLKVKKGKVKLSWKKVKGATGYQVYASTKKNGKYRLVDDDPYSRTPKTTIYTNVRKDSLNYAMADIHLKKGKKYYFKVRVTKEFDEDESTVCSKFSKKVRSKKLK